MLRTLVYSKPCHIQDQMHTQGPEIFRSLAYSEREAYSATMERFAEIVNGYNFLKLKLFSQYQLFTFSFLGNKHYEFF